jgi:hypothetical protein
MGRVCANCGHAVTPFCGRVPQVPGRTVRRRQVRLASVRRKVSKSGRYWIRTNDFYRVRRPRNTLRRDKSLISKPYYAILRRFARPCEAECRCAKRRGFTAPLGCCAVRAALTRRRTGGGSASRSKPLAPGNHLPSAHALTRIASSAISPTAVRAPWSPQGHPYLGKRASTAAIEPIPEGHRPPESIRQNVQEWGELFPVVEQIDFGAFAARLWERVKAGVRRFAAFAVDLATSPTGPPPARLPGIPFEGAHDRVLNASPGVAGELHAAAWVEAAAGFEQSDHAFPKEIFEEHGEVAAVAAFRRR